jgi:hypothetical protein
MSHIVKKVDKFINEILNATYSQEWPMNKQEIGVTQDDLKDTDYYKHENKFQEVQEHMKVILKSILLKKNPNANDQDVEKVSDAFFRLGNEKAQEVKKLVDNCKDTKQCARQIVDRYYKYVKINFGTKDNINDVEQNSVMTNEELTDKQKDNIDIIFQVLLNALKNGGESSFIRDMEKFKQKIGDRFDEYIEDQYFVNKIEYLKQKAIELHCMNAYEYLENYLQNNEIIENKTVENFDEFILERKRQQRRTNITDVESIPGGIKYHNEIFPGLNIPKRYVGKGEYRWRVLAAEGGKVKPVNFGDKKETIVPISRLKKKYWENIPTYKY